MHTNACMSKTHMHPNVLSSIIYNSQYMEATYVSTSRRRAKENGAHTHTHTHTHTGLWLSHKIWTSAVCNNMHGLEGVTLTEIGQKQMSTLGSHFYVESKN